MKSACKLIVLVLAFVALAASAYAQATGEQLNQMVEQLRKTPNDNALREKIIKLALEVDPAPAVSPEAKRAFVMGGIYQKEARSLEDFGLAVKAFQDATMAAPWWGDAYYNLSVSLESAKRYDEAKVALTLYLLTSPKDAEQAQERLYAIDAKKTMAAAADAKRRANLEGRWNSYGAVEFEIRKDGNAFTLVPNTQVGPIGHWLAENVAISGGRVEFAIVQPACPACRSQYSLALSDDGAKLKGTIRTFSSGAVYETFFDRK